METLIKIFEILFPVIGTIVVALIGAASAKDREEYKKKIGEDEARAKLRERESRLSMKLADANLQLAVVTANALTNGHNNGNVERAKSAAEEASKEYAAFLQEVAAHEVCKN